MAGMQWTRSTKNFQRVRALTFKLTSTKNMTSFLDTKDILGIYFFFFFLKKHIYVLKITVLLIYNRILAKGRILG